MIVIIVPVLGVVLRPEFLEMFERRTDEGESFRPHTLREEGGDTGDAIAGEAVGGTSGLKFLRRGKIEEGIDSGFHGVEEGNRDAVVNDLECPPSLEGIADELGGIRERKVN